MDRSRHENCIFSFRDLIPGDIVYGKLGSYTITQDMIDDAVLFGEGAGCPVGIITKNEIEELFNKEYGYEAMGL